MDWIYIDEPLICLSISPEVWYMPPKMQNLKTQPTSRHLGQCKTSVVLIGCLLQIWVYKLRWAAMKLDQYFLAIDTFAIHVGGQVKASTHQQWFLLYMEWQKPPMTGVSSITNIYYEWWSTQYSGIFFSFLVFKF